MENSMGVGLMTVFAVSGSMALLVHQVHKHLFNNFMKKFECEVRGDLYPHHPKSLSGSTKHQTKRVRFAEQVLELPVEKAQEVKEYEKVLDMDDSEKWRPGQELKDIMPPNRVALYRGIMKYRALKGSLDFLLLISSFFELDKLRVLKFRESLKKDLES